MSIRHAIIPAAGFGTRMLPAAKAIPKELLPILDRPTIQYVAQEAAEAGITDLLLITSSEKPSLEDHFRRNTKLDQRLSTTGKQALLASINDLLRRITMHAVDQPEPRGLGDAVLQARAFAGDQPFLCLLGDTIFSGYPAPAQQMIDAYEQLGTSIIGLEEVPAERVSRYGIVGGTEISQGVWKLDALIEKPRADQAPSRLAIAARYILTPAIFDCLDRVIPGIGGEVQLTDAMRLLLEREPIHGVVLAAKRHDIGNPTDWLKTNLIYAHRDPTLWKEILPLLKALIG